MPLFSSCSYYSSLHLFFALDAAFEIDLGHFLGFVATIIVFVLVAHVFFIFTVVAYQTILGIGTDWFSTTLGWEANLTKHAWMLVLLANNQAYLSVFHSKDRGGVTITTFHKVNQTVS